jgi:hypothetical protein
MYKLQRREALDRQIEHCPELPTLKPMVQRLQCFREISLHSAMVLATELVDWRRFERPGQLACYLGLVSREDSNLTAPPPPASASCTFGRNLSACPKFRVTVRNTARAPKYRSLYSITVPFAVRYPNFDRLNGSDTRSAMFPWSPHTL